MSTVYDIGERRARRARASGPPNRDPDFSVHAWMKDGEVDWTWTQFGENSGLTHDAHRIAALIDVAWMHGSSPEHIAHDLRPALWWMVNNAGQCTLIYPRSLYEGATWRQALWLIRRWWQITTRMARLAWWMTRGRR